MINEQDLRDAIDNICSTQGVKGHLFIYLDGDKLKFIGNISVSALAPLLMDWFMRTKK